MELSHIYKIQDKTKYSTVDITDILITVDYDPVLGVTEVVNVKAKDKVYGGSGSVDIAPFCMDVLNLGDPKVLNNITDWLSLYHQELQSRKELFELSQEENL